jgi:nitrate/nitrite transporter NarK
LIGVVMALAMSVGFVQFLERILGDALAGHALHSMDDYALILNTPAIVAARVLISSFMALLGGYLCAKFAETDEMRYTLIAVIFRVIVFVGFNRSPYMPQTPVWALALLLTISSAAMLLGGAIRAAVQRKKEMQ